jgi:hypothetical protein
VSRLKVHCADRSGALPEALHMLVRLKKGLCDLWAAVTSAQEIHAEIQRLDVDRAPLSPRCPESGRARQKVGNCGSDSAAAGDHDIYLRHARGASDSLYKQRIGWEPVIELTEQVTDGWQSSRQKVTLAVEVNSVS